MASVKKKEKRRVRAKQRAKEARIAKQKAREGLNKLKSLLKGFHGQGENRMKAGDLVKHTLNDNARGMILTEGSIHRGEKFFIVDQLTEKGAEARRSKPDELIGVEND